MRNQFICEIPESVREQLSRDAIEELDTFIDGLDDADTAEPDDVDDLWGLRHLMN